MRIIIFILFLFITSPHTTLADEVTTKPSLTVYTYDSFTSDWGPGPKIKEEFEKECNCDLNFVGLTDAVEILSRIQFEGKETKADLVLGLDDNLIADAKKTNLFARNSTDLNKINIPGGFSDDIFVPYDYGYFSFIYDSSKLTNVPNSFDDLISDKNSLSIIIQDPRTSSPGLGLLLWVKSIYGDKSNEIWEELSKKILTVTQGWSEAYGMFLEGEADMVLSYTTSPAYHITAEGEGKYKAAEFKEGHYSQIEVAAKLINNSNDELSDQFLQFLISKKAQSILPTTQWMYPVISITDGIPDSFNFLVEPNKVLSLESKDISKNRKEWTRDWEKSLSK